MANFRKLQDKYLFFRPGMNETSGSPRYTASVTIFKYQDFLIVQLPALNAMCRLMPSFVSKPSTRGVD